MMHHQFNEAFKAMFHLNETIPGEVIALIHEGEKVLVNVIEVLPDGRLRVEFMDGKHAEQRAVVRVQREARAM